MERYKSLLNRLSTGPLQHVVWPTGLVVSAGQPGAAERLLADNGAGGFVVNVKVSSGSLQNISCTVGKFPENIKIVLMC